LNFRVPGSGPKFRNNFALAFQKESFEGGYLYYGFHRGSLYYRFRRGSLYYRFRRGSLYCGYGSDFYRRGGGKCFLRNLLRCLQNRTRNNNLLPPHGARFAINGSSQKSTSVHKIILCRIGS
jgi:hypothetical protein